MPPDLQKMKSLIPNKFLCRYSLATGALIFGFLMVIVKILCLIVTVVVMIDFSRCSTNCTDFVSNNSYGFNVTAMIYFVIMILVHLSFIWAIKKKKPTIIMGWVAVMILWLFMTICLTTVLLCLYSKQTSFVLFIVCTIFACLGFCVVIYAVMIGIGLWREMQSATAGDNP